MAQLPVTTLAKESRHPEMMPSSPLLESQLLTAMPIAPVTPTETVKPTPLAMPTVLSKPAAPAMHAAPAMPAMPSVLALPIQSVQIRPNLSDKERRQVQNVLDEQVHLFAIGEQGFYSGTEHEIELLPDATPYSRQPYRYSRDDRRFLERQTTDLLEKGIITPSAEPWAFPAVVVSQATKKRLCGNYIPLNRMTVTVVQPLPRADDIMKDIGGCSLFASLDLKFAYWQIPLRVPDQDKTAFITHQGTYKWTRMPFGLKNAPVVLKMRPLRLKGQ